MSRTSRSGIVRPVSVEPKSSLARTTPTPPKKPEIPRKLEIFLSHKMGVDSAAANEIKAALGGYGGDQVVVHCSSDYPLGANWQELVRNCLKKSNWLILLYTDPTLDWGWCLYEVGAFEGLYPFDKRIICLHDPRNPPPNALRSFVPLPAIESKITELFQDIFVKKPWAINPTWYLQQSSDLIPECVRKIRNAVIGKDPGVAAYYSTTIEIRILPNQVDTWKKGIIPDEAIVTGSGAWEAAFGKPMVGSWTWAQLTMESPQRETWVPLLVDLMQSAEQAHSVEATRLLFRPFKTGPAFRPVIHKLQRTADGELRFTILLSEVPIADEFDSSDDLAIIHQITVLAWHFRRRLYEKYINRLQELLLEEDLTDEKTAPLYKELGQDLSILYADSFARGIHRSGQILKRFDEPDRKVLAPLMQERWPTAAKLLSNALKRGHKGLPDVVKAFEDMTCINREFYRRTTHRYSELAAKLHYESLATKMGD